MASRLEGEGDERRRPLVSARTWPPVHRGAPSSSRPPRVSAPISTHGKRVLAAKARRETAELRALTLRRARAQPPVPSCPRRPHPHANTTLAPRLLRYYHRVSVPHASWLMDAPSNAATTVGASLPFTSPCPSWPYTPHPRNIAAPRKERLAGASPPPTDPGCSGWTSFWPEARASCAASHMRCL